MSTAQYHLTITKKFRHGKRDKMQGKVRPWMPLTILPLLLVIVGGQTIPVKLDGFVYCSKTSEFNPNRILIEAFFDPVCPDSRNSWSPLKRALHYYGSRVSLIVHPFPLPYHDNAFVSSRGLHIVNELNNSATFPLWEKFFKHQEKFYNKKTINMSRSEIVEHIIDFVTASVGNAYSSAIKSGFNDRKTDLKTRVSFEYGCSRGVFGTPTFFVNGFAVPHAGSSIDYKGWKKIIDPLVSSKRKHALHHFL